MKTIKKNKRIKKEVVPNPLLYIAGNGKIVNNSVINYTTDSEFFLRRPIENLIIEPALKRKLVVLCDTIYEVLIKHTERDLKRIRGFGEKKMKDFKLLLIENNSLHLLK